MRTLSHATKWQESRSSMLANEFASLTGSRGNVGYDRSRSRRGITTSVFRETRNQRHSGVSSGKFSRPAVVCVMKKDTAIFGRMCTANEMYRGQIPICMRGEPVYLESFAYRDQTARLIYAGHRFLARRKRQIGRETLMRTIILSHYALVCFSVKILERIVSAFRLG